MSTTHNVSGGDLAIVYTSDLRYDAGTAVIFGGACEITRSTQYCDHRWAGIVSDTPAYVLNSQHQGIAIAIKGRVAALVTGAVKKGDLLVTSWTAGHLVSVKNDLGIGAAVIAKSLVDDAATGSRLVQVAVI